MSASHRIIGSTLALLALIATAPGLVSAAGDPAGWGVPGEGPGQMRSPFAIALTADRAYVADFDNDRVEVFTRTGEALQAWGGPGSEPGRFGGPAGVAVGPDGSVFVTDLRNRRVQRFTADGVLVSSWPAGAEDAAPFGVAVDRLGRVLVTDLEAGRVRVWNSEGTLLATWGTRGSAQGELVEPWGIAVGEDGDVFVADHGNDRIQRFSDDGRWLGGWGDGPAEEARLAGPMGVAVGPDGSVYATDLAGDRVRRFTPAGDLISTSRRTDASMDSRATGLALDAGGDMFVVDPERRRVIRIAGAQTVPPAPSAAAFAMMPIVQPLGRGPVILDFAIPGPGTMGAEFFSLDGRRVRAVEGVRVDGGVQRITWDTVTDEGDRAPVGMYFVRAHFDDGGRRITCSGRVVVLR